MNINKHGIPVDTSSKRQRLQRLNFRKFAEFIRNENDIEVKIVVPYHRPVIEALLEDGWQFLQISRGDII